MIVSSLLSLASITSHRIARKLQISECPKETDLREEQLILDIHDESIHHYIRNIASQCNKMSLSLVSQANRSNPSKLVGRRTKLGRGSGHFRAKSHAGAWKCDRSLVIDTRINCPRFVMVHSWVFLERVIHLHSYHRTLRNTSSHLGSR